MVRHDMWKVFFRQEYLSIMFLLPYLKNISSNIFASNLPIEPCDCIECWIEAVNLNPLAVGLEALDHHGLHKHLV